MSMRVSWEYNPTVVVTSFTLTRSIDKGLTYAALAVIPFDVGGANFDRARKQFFYNDAGGAVGYIYKLVSTGANGTSEPTFIIAPPDPPGKCVVIGYTTGPFGIPDRTLPVHVYAAGVRGENWVANPVGLVAQHGQALGLSNGEATVYPDANGMWQIEMVRGCMARVYVPALEFEWVFTVPDEAGPKNIRDIPQLRGTDAHTIWPEMLGSRTVITQS